MWKWIFISLPSVQQHFSVIVHSSLFSLSHSKWHENCFGKLNAVTFNYVIISENVDMSTCTELERREVWHWGKIGFHRPLANVLIWRLHQFFVIMWLHERESSRVALQREFSNMFSTLISWNRWNEMSQFPHPDHHKVSWRCSNSLTMTYQVDFDSSDRMLWLFMTNIEFYRHTHFPLVWANFLLCSVSLVSACSVSLSIKRREAKKFSGSHGNSREWLFN